MTRPLALYRNLIRAARGLPTENRRQLVLKRSRVEFERARICEPSDAQFLLEVGEVHRLPRSAEFAADGEV